MKPELSLCHCQLFMTTSDLETQQHNTVKWNRPPPRLQKKWHDSSIIQVFTPRVGGKKQKKFLLHHVSYAVNLP